MAARRLLIVMLVLLGISSVIAVITPNPRKEAAEREEQVSGASGATGASGETGETGPADGDPARPASIEAAASAVATGPIERDLEAGDEVKPIDVKPGRRLILRVKAPEPAEITVPDLGLTAFAGPYAPAYLDLLVPARTGRYPIFSAAPGDPTGEVVAVIAVGG